MEQRKFPLPCSSVFFASRFPLVPFRLSVHRHHRGREPVCPWTDSRNPLARRARASLALSRASSFSTCLGDICHHERSRLGRANIFVLFRSISCPHHSPSDQPWGRRLPRLIEVVSHSTAPLHKRHPSHHPSRGDDDCHRHASFRAPGPCRPAAPASAPTVPEPVSLCMCVCVGII